MWGRPNSVDNAESDVARATGDVNVRTACARREGGKEGRREGGNEGTRESAKAMRKRKSWELAKSVRARTGYRV